MNMMLHGIENPISASGIRLREEHAGEEERYSLVLANPPFAGSLDYEATRKGPATDRQDQKDRTAVPGVVPATVEGGGRAAVIVPDGVLFGSSNAHKELRKLLVEEHKLDAVISLPSGVFRPYAGVSTAILLFTKTGVRRHGNVWFYDVQADGYSLDDKRNALLPEDKLGPRPPATLSETSRRRTICPTS